MASVLELALDGKITVEDVVLWLLSKGKDKNLPSLLQENNKTRQEYIPYFLNYLRDQTLHLLQHSKSSNTSPSKTPVSTQNVKQWNKKTNNSKRTQLFADNLSHNLSQSKDLCTPILSPGNESPVFCNLSDRNKKYDQKFNNYQSRHKSPNATPEPNRGKYKLCLGEFMSPDPMQKRKSSPFSTHKDNRENSPSPTVMAETRNKSSGKKRAAFHSISKSTGIVKQSFPPTPVFRLSDNDFPPVNKLENRDETPKPKPKRRINPTQLLPDAKINAAAKFSRLAEVVEKLPYNSPIRTKSDSVLSTRDCDICFADERELLRKEKAKRQALQENQSSYSPIPSISTVSTPSKSFLDRQASSSSSTDYVVARKNRVTYENKLDILADLYSRCVDDHLFPNISVELYFLIQLLTSLSEEVKSETTAVNQDSEDIRLFSSVHNAVYFSISVLQRQLNLLKYLDKSVIKLLSENKRIIDFSPALQSGLLQLYENSSSLKKIPCYPRSPIGGVSFQADTDNRKNFPNDKLFHQFKKQRDMFYELIREWEEKRLSSGWSVIDMLGDRIRYLINVKTELVNHLHFARLFLSQLISMCKGDGMIRTEDDDDNIALLAHLKKNNPEKFKKLQERFIQPFSVGGPCPPSSFPGNQEFFKEFIMAASSPIFNQHLSNTFTAKIKKLNSTEFSQNPSEENQESEGVNQDQYELFSSGLLTLRLLGKFLGFVTFLPYQSVDSLPESMQSNYIELRNNQPCPLDVLEFIHSSHHTYRLTLTIPWIIEYLSMMDKTAPLLHYYQLVLLTLQYIHRLSWQKVKEEAFYFGHLMLATLLGWLFESPMMPQGIFLMELSDDIPGGIAIESSLKPVDNLELVNQELLYTVCPYLGEMRTLLVEFAVGASSRPTIRKITPVAADDLPEPETGRNLQTQLEENYFHNHPGSLKRTVEFVAERTASNFIKHFRSTDLPWSITEAKSRLNNLLVISDVVSPTNKLKDRSQLELIKLAQCICEDVRKKVADCKREYCYSRVTAAVSILLPDEQTPAVINMAASISCRVAEERIKTWITNHITTSMFLKEINTETDRIYKKELLDQVSSKKTINNSEIKSLDLPLALLNITSDNSTSSVLSQAVLIPTSTTEYLPSKHRDDIIPLSQLLSQLRDVDKQLTVTKDSTLDHIRLIILMEEANKILLFKEDTIPQAIRSLAQIILDLSLTLISYKPDLITNKYVEMCKTLWKNGLKDHTIFLTVSSTRWFYLLLHSPHKQIAQKKYVSFIVMLMEEEFITPQMFDKGCLKVIYNSSICTTYIKESLCDIVNYFNSKQDVNVDFTETLNILELKNNHKKEVEVLENVSKITVED